MGTPAKRSVVLVPFPFSDLNRAKLRPAVVLADAGRNSLRRLKVPVVQTSGLIGSLRYYDNTAMQRLVDIEQAVQNLSAEQQAESLLFVAERLRSQRVPLPEPREFSQEQLQAWLDEDEQAVERFRSGL